MIRRVATVAFEGIEARAVDVQVQVAPGLPAFNIVGRITVNLAPADLPKEGSHYDLPIALGLMGAIGAIPHDALSGFTVLGELALDGSIAPVAGVLPAAIGANGARLRRDTGFPHCHNSVSGPWCRGITSYEYDSGVRISQSKSPSKLKYRIVNAYGHSRHPSATQPVRAPATDLGKPRYTGTYFVIAGLRRPMRIGDARLPDFADNGPDRRIGSTAGSNGR